MFDRKHNLSDRAAIDHQGVADRIDLLQNVCQENPLQCWESRRDIVLHDFNQGWLFFIIRLD